MSRTLSLRGTVTCADNARVTDNQVFIYEANDLTRGWVVEAAYIWPKTVRAGIGSASGQFQLCASIATDVIGAAGFDEICDTGDNRQIAWAQPGYQLRNSAVTDFLSNGGSPPSMAFLVDPEHIVANGLWLNVTTISDSSTSPSREWNYMIVLKPKRLDPKQTILHLIKNVAQDVVN